VATKTLREEGYAGRIVLIGREPGIPFGRPPLSKTYLRGEEDLSGWLVKPAAWFKGNDVELVRETASRLDANARSVTLDTGAVIPYDKLLIATGGRNRRLPLPGIDLPGVHQLRTVADSDAIRTSARRGRKALVAGMGFIGSEVAASLRQMGVEVTAVLPGSAPLEAVLGAEIGNVIAGIHRDEGVELIPGDQVVRFEGGTRVQRAVTRHGRRLECDFAIVAAGIEPDVDLLQDTDVAVDNGVLVDAACRTNVTDIFAAGDVANHMHPLFGRIRVEHYNNAEKQGAAAAKSMLGRTDEYRYVHSFWSDQYAHKLEYVGYVRRWDQFVLRGSLRDRSLVGFYLRADVLCAAVGLDRGGDPELDEDGELAKAGRLIARSARPALAALGDEDVDLDLL
jgi:3-phenylpropionate/trans-cinnamate dioxygenase ferredoxin reductase subunit